MITSINTISPLDAARYEGLKQRIPRNEGEDTASSVGSKKNLSDKEQEAKTISEKTEEIRQKKKEDAFSKKELTSFEDKINEAMKEENLKIEFSKDEETKRMILKLIDKETQEVVHQYPPEITLKIARIVANTLEQGSLTNTII
jgi:flagellar protein FlaG